MPYIKEPGTYNAKCVLPRSAAQLFTTSNSGKDGIALDFVTEDGLEISTVLWLTPAAYERTLKVLDQVFKFDGDFNALAKNLSFPNYDCKIVVEMEEYQKDGVTKQAAKVKWINSRGPTRKDSDVGGVLSRLSKQSGQAPPSKEEFAAESATEGEDWSSDSIPFAPPHYIAIGGF